MQLVSFIQVSVQGCIGSSPCWFWVHFFVCLGLLGLNPCELEFFFKFGAAGIEPMPAWFFVFEFRVSVGIEPTFFGSIDQIFFHCAKFPGSAHIYIYNTKGKSRDCKNQLLFKAIGFIYRIYISLDMSTSHRDNGL